MWTSLRHIMPKYKISATTKSWHKLVYCATIFAVSNWQDLNRDQEMTPRSYHHSDGLWNGSIWSKISIGGKSSIRLISGVTFGELFSGSKHDGVGGRCTFPISEALPCPKTSKKLGTSNLEMNSWFSSEGKSRLSCGGNGIDDCNKLYGFKSLGSNSSWYRLSSKLSEVGCIRSVNLFPSCCLKSRPNTSSLCFPELNSSAWKLKMIIQKLLVNGFIDFQYWYSIKERAI